MKTIRFHERDVIDGKLVSLGDSMAIFEANDEYPALALVYVEQVDYSQNHAIAYVRHVRPVKDLKIKVEDY